MSSTNYVSCTCSDQLEHFSSRFTLHVSCTLYNRKVLSIMIIPDYLFRTDELIIKLTDRIRLFVHDKSHKYRVTETSYYDVTVV